MIFLEEIIDREMKYIGFFVIILAIYKHIYLVTILFLPEYKATLVEYKVGQLAASRVASHAAPYEIFLRPTRARLWGVYIFFIICASNEGVP